MVSLCSFKAIAEVAKLRSSPPFGKRQFLSCYACWLAVIVMLCTSASLTRAADRPNVIFILADDLGRHDCGFMGGTEFKTPHLDRLARAGAILHAFYVQPVCSDSHLMGGLSLFLGSSSHGKFEPVFYAIVE